MVLKRGLGGLAHYSEFENDVNMYGTQAIRIKQKETGEFENDVTMYGTQAHSFRRSDKSLFENDVNMYGTQAPQFVRIAMQRLRMM